MTTVAPTDITTLLNTTATTEAVVIPNYSIISLVEIYNEPIISSAQGPQGIQGPIGAIGPTGPVGPSGTLTGAPDLDITVLVNGSMLVYNAVLSKWQATKILQNQTVECGQY